MWVRAGEGAAEAVDEKEWAEYAESLFERAERRRHGDKGLEGPEIADGEQTEEIQQAESEDDLEDESRKVTRMLDPKLPTDTEVKERQLTHLPYRNWCHHCIKGRGKEGNHERQKVGNEQGVPE